MKRALLLAACAGALALAASARGKPPAPAGAPTLRVVDFNVLAPVWASPVWYPEGMDPSLLDTVYRRALITSFLSSRAATTDVFCLQEVQESELPFFLAALGPRFVGAISHNDPDWWENWLVLEIPWAPNGTAVIVKRSSLSGRFEDLAISDDGNHALLFEGTYRPTGARMRVASVHLDSDSESNRVREARSLLEQMPEDAAATDIACGDMNQDTERGSLSNLLGSAHFVNVLAALGNREPTHPWSTTYYASDKWAILDHVLVRHGVPLGGDVLDFGVWSITDQVARIEANFRNTGSDHFPLEASIGLD